MRQYFDSLCLLQKGWGRELGTCFNGHYLFEPQAVPVSYQEEGQKKRSAQEYLAQISKNKWPNKKSRQKTLAFVGRITHTKKSLFWSKADVSCCLLFLPFLFQTTSHSLIQASSLCAPTQSLAYSSTTASVPSVWTFQGMCQQNLIRNSYQIEFVSEIMWSAGLGKTSSPSTVRLHL